MLKRQTKLRIELLEPRIVLGVIVTAGNFFDYLDAEGTLQRILVTDGSVDVDGIDNPLLADTLERLTILETGTAFESSAVELGELMADGAVTSYEGAFGIDVFNGLNLVSAKSGTIGSVVVGDGTAATLQVGQLLVTGNVDSFDVGGDWDGTFTATGAVGILNISGDLNESLQAASFQSVSVTGSIIGSLTTAAGGAVGTLQAAELSGTVTLGTVGDRGTLGTYNITQVTGTGRLDAAIDGDGALSYLGQNLTTAPGAAFAVTATGLTLQGNSLTDFVYGDSNVSLTGGSSGYFELAAGSNDIGIYLTTAPGGSGIAVTDATGAAIAAIGADGISVSLISLDVEGSVDLLGGAANRNGGGLVDITDLTIDGLLGTATISGAGGDWVALSDVTLLTVGGNLSSLDVDGHLTTLDVGGNLTTLLVTGNLTTLDVGQHAGSLTVNGGLGEATIGGNVGSLIVDGEMGDVGIGGSLTTLTAGNGAGNISAGSLLTSLSVTGSLASFTTTGDAAGTIDVTGDATTISIGGNLAAGTTIDGAVTLLDVGGNLTSTVAIGNTLGTLDVTGNLSGSVATGNNKSIGAIDVGGAISGSISAGNPGQRGAISSIAYGSVEGAGLVIGKMDGGGSLDWNAVTVLAPANLRFQVDSAGLLLDATGGNVTVGNVQIATGQSGGTTEASVFASHDRSDIDVTLTALGADATLAVTDTEGLDGADIRNIGLDAITGELSSLSVEGSLTTLGGAANVGLGNLTTVQSLTVAGDVGSATISDRMDGSWSSTGGSFGTVNIFWVLGGTLTAAVDIGEVSTAGLSGSVTATTGDIGRITTSVGDLGGTVSAGDEIGSLISAGNLWSRVTGKINSAGDLARFGETSGTLNVSENGGATAGAVTIVGSADVSINNAADTDYLAAPAGGIEIDLAAVSAGAAITSSLDLDEVTAAASVASLNLGAGDLGRYRQTAGNFTGSIAAGDVNRIDLAADLSAAATVNVNSVQLLDAGGNIDGTVNIAASAGELSAGADIGGNVTIGGDLTSADAASLSGTLDVSGTATELTVTGDISGSATVGGSATTVNAGDVSNVLDVTGDLGTLTVTGDISGSATVGGSATTVNAGDVSGTIAADGSITTLNIGTNLSGTVSSGAGEAIEDISIGGSLTGAIRAGTLADRGAIEAINYGSIAGAGLVTGEVAADGTLDWDGTTVAAAAGRHFDIDAAGFSLDGGGAAVTIGNRQVTLGESAGATEAAYWISHDLVDFDLLLTSLGTDATVAVTDSGAADAAHVRNFGLDGTSGDVASVIVEGRVTTLGGAANANGGDLVNLGMATLAGGAGAITISGDWTGGLDSGGSVGPMQIGGNLGDAAGDNFSATAFGDVTVGGNMVGTLASTVGGVGNVDANSISGAVSSAAAIGTISTTADLGGTVTAATGISDITAGGNLSAVVTATSASIGNVDAGGRLSGSLSAVGDIGEVTVGDNLTGSLLAGGDVGDLTVTGELSGSVTAVGIGDVTAGEELSGSVIATGGDIGNLTVQSGGLSGTVEAAAGAIGIIDITGNLGGSVESAATITDATVSGDLAGTLRSTTGSIDTLEAGSISGTVEAAADIGSVTSAGNISGSIEALGGDIGDIVATAGSLSGTVRAEQSIRSVLADATTAAALIEAVQGDIGSIVTDTGDMAGTITAGDEIGLLSAAGNLTATVSGAVDAGGNLAAQGRTSGLMVYSQGGAEVGRITATAGDVGFTLNDATDVDVLNPATMAGGIDLDLTIDNVAAAIATTVDVDRLIAASDVASIGIGGRLGSGSFAAALSGDVDVTGDVQELTLAANQTADSEIAVGGNLVELDIAGNQSGTIDITGNATTITLAANQAGGVTVGGTLGELTILGDQADTGTIDATGVVTLLDITGEQAGAIIARDEVATLNVGLDQSGTIDITGNATTITLDANQTGGVTVGGTLGELTILGDQADTGTIDATGIVTLLDITGEQAGSIIARDEVATLNVGLDQSGTIDITGNATTITLNADQAGGVTVGGTLGELTILGDQADTGTIDATGIVTLLDITGEQAGAIIAGNNVIALNVGLDQSGTIEIIGHAAFHFSANQTGDLTVGGMAAILIISGDQAGTVEAGGNSVLIDIGGEQSGTLTVHSSVDQLLIGHDQSGTIAIGGYVSMIGIDGNQTGSLTLDNGLDGMGINGDQTGVIEVTGTTTLLHVGQNLAGTVTGGGAITTLDVDGDIAATGAVSTAAAQDIVNIDIGGTLDGTIDAGVAGNRGRISVVDLGSFGTGRIDGQFDAALTLDVNGRTWLLEPGDSNEFRLHDDELSMQSFAALTRDTFSIELTETAGSTLGSIVVALDASYLDLLVNQLGDNAGVAVHHTDAATTVVRDLGFDTVSGNLHTVDVHGSIESLGGASNANGGDIVDLHNLTTSGDVTGAVISGDITGTWQSGGGSFGTITAGGTVSGSITAQQDIRSITAAALAPTAEVETLAGDIGSITATTGDMGGTITAADEIGSLTAAAGNLAAYVRGHIDSAGNIDLLGQTVGRFSYSDASGANVADISGGRARVILNDPADVDVNVLPVDFDIRDASAGSALTVSGSADSLAWSAAADSLNVGGSVGRLETGGDFAGNIAIGGHAEEMLIGGNALGDTVYAGSMHLLHVDGDLTGYVSTAPDQPLDILEVTGDVSGYVLTGGHLLTRGSVDEVTIGNITGVIQGKVNEAGWLTYNGANFAIEPGFSFIIDPACLRPEFNNIEHAYSLTTTQAMNDSALVVERYKQLAADIRDAELSPVGSGDADGGGAFSAAQGPLMLWTLQPTASGLTTTMTAVRLANFGNIPDWLVPQQDYRAEAATAPMTEYADDASTGDASDSGDGESGDDETSSSGETSGEAPPADDDGAAVEAENDDGQPADDDNNVAASSPAPSTATIRQ